MPTVNGVYAMNPAVARRKASDTSPLEGDGLSQDDAAAPGINEKAIKGEPGTEFEERGDLGEFECENCSFFSENLPSPPPDGEIGCHQPDMMEKSKRPRNDDGSVQIGPEDCCEYVDRIGKKDDDGDEEDEEHDDADD